MPPSDPAPRILVTAGPTHEPIDAVRYLGNRSSGRMGLALAEAARRRGNPVTLLLGPGCPTPPVDFWSEIESENESGGSVRLTGATASTGSTGSPAEIDSPTETGVRIPPEVPHPSPTRTGNQPRPEDQSPAVSLSPRTPPGATGATSSAGESPEAGRADSRRGSGTGSGSGSGSGFRSGFKAGPNAKPDAKPDANHSIGYWQRFQSTADLQRLLAVEFPRHDVLIMAAAVADFRPAGGAASGKHSRSPDGLRIDLEPTPDLVAELAASARSDQLLIGFALEEPDQLTTRAQAKLAAKGLHAIVANPLATMDAARITATVFIANAPPRQPAPNLTKPQFAEWLLDQLPDISQLAR